MNKKKYKHIFFKFRDYKNWKEQFAKVKHLALMDITSGIIYVSY